MHFYMQNYILIRHDWLITNNLSKSIISCSVLITIMMTCCNYTRVIGLKPNTVRFFLRCRDIIFFNICGMSIIKNFSNGISSATILITGMASSYNHLSIRSIISFTCRLFFILHPLYIPDCNISISNNFSIGRNRF